ncbi:MAG: PhoH family protein [Patescibacteria group bacterium]
MQSPDLNKLNSFFEELPGVGPKTAERFVFHMLKQPPANIEDIIEILKSIKGINFVYLNESDVVRHALVKEIIRAYDRYVP